MKKIIFNPVNIIIIMILLLVTAMVNYKENVKDYNEMKEILEESCYKLNEESSRILVSMCEDYIANDEVYEKPLLDEVVSNNLYFISMLSIFLVPLFTIVTIFRFHRFSHTGYMKNILTRDSYKNILRKEFKYGIISCLYVFTAFFLLILLLSYISSNGSIEGEIMPYILSLVNVYLQTFMFYILLALISLITVKKVKNIFLSILASWFIIFITYISLDFIGTLSTVFNYKFLKLEVFDYLINFYNEGVPIYFIIMNIIINIILSYVLINTYKVKEEYLIEIEK